MVLQFIYDPQTISDHAERISATFSRVFATVSAPSFQFTSRAELNVNLIGLGFLQATGNERNKFLQKKRNLNANP